MLGSIPLRKDNIFTLDVWLDINMDRTNERLLDKQENNREH